MLRAACDAIGVVSRRRSTTRGAEIARQSLASACSASSRCCERPSVESAQLSAAAGQIPASPARRRSTCRRNHPSAQLADGARSAATARSARLRGRSDRHARGGRDAPLPRRHQRRHADRRKLHHPPVRQPRRDAAGPQVPRRAVGARRRPRLRGARVLVGERRHRGRRRRHDARRRRAADVAHARRPRLHARRPRRPRLRRGARRPRPRRRRRAGVGHSASTRRRASAPAPSSSRSTVVDDLIPYGLAVGNRATLRGLNLVGLRRAGAPRDEQRALRGFRHRLPVGLARRCCRRRSPRSRRASRSRDHDAAAAAPRLAEVCESVLGDRGPGHAFERALCWPERGAAPI